jgi:hypothetical protein
MEVSTIGWDNYQYHPISKKKTGFTLPQIFGNSRGKILHHSPGFVAIAAIAAFPSRIGVQSQQPADPVRTQRPEETQHKGA